MSSDELLQPDLLSAYLDGELTAGERAAVDAQLAVSVEWRFELAEVRAARDAVRALPMHEAPAAFWDAVRTDVESVDEDSADVVLPTAAARSRAAARRRWAWIAAAAAAAAAFVAVIVVPHRNHVSPNVTAVVAQHGAQSSDNGDPVSMLAPIGPLTGFRR